MKTLLAVLALLGLGIAGIGISAGSTRSVGLGSEAEQDFARLWQRSVLAHAERMVCLTVKDSRITSAHDYPWQVADSFEVTQFGKPCEQGSAHTHIFGNANFSRVDSLSLGSGIHCVLHSSTEALCISDSTEYTVKYR